MARLEDMMKDRVAAMAKGTSIERLTDDDDVREWLVLGRLAMIFCLWAAMICTVLLVISVRF
jgi:hypothetical protein